MPYLQHLHQQTNSDILIVAYRGFSSSEGTPTERGLQLDAEAILDFAAKYKTKSNKHGKTKNIYLLGRSLGGAVAIYSSTIPKFKKVISGLILENTFTSI